jgi:hypothetical protein
MRRETQAALDLRPMLRLSVGRSGAVASAWLNARVVHAHEHACNDDCEIKVERVASLFRGLVRST